MNDLSATFEIDLDALLRHAAPPEAPLAMPLQVLERQDRRLMTALLDSLRPARRVPRGL